MNAYAPNNSSANGGEGGGGFAQLTSSLLARKGEALPAVDAVAHEGVDIDMRPMKPANSPGAPSSVGEEAIETLSPGNKARPRSGAGGRAPSVRLVHSSGARSRAAEEAPQAWTLPGGRLRPRPRPGAHHGAHSGTGAGAPPTGVLARKAIVTLRMPARDLVRLKLASRDLEMSCQAIILDALECYLDANDVPSASDDEAIRREVERLMSKAKAKRRG
jgi:hypothetical protein